MKKMLYPNQVQNYGDQCELCNGSGWILSERETTPDEYKEVSIISVAKPCKKCRSNMIIQEQTGILPEYSETDISKFDFEAYKTANMDKLKKIIYSFVEYGEMWKRSSKGLYLWSQTAGTGKTFLSCSIARSMMIKHGFKMRFITAPDYISAVAEYIKSERGSIDISAIYRECDLLVLDDIGTQISKEWQQQEMFRLINSRLSNGLITIFTSNYPPEQLNVDDRTKSRIEKASVVLQMPEESIRKQKAKSEQEEFLKTILSDD